MTEDDALPTWTIYYNATDYPGMYVVRRFLILGGGRGLHHDALPCFVGETLEGARESLPHERGLVMLARAASDPPQVVETWM